MKFSDIMVILNCIGLFIFWLILTFTPIIMDYKNEKEE